MKATVFNILGAVLLGFCMMVGMRAGEWLISKPEARVVFCVYTADDTDEDKPATCRTLEQWVGEARK